MSPRTTLTRSIRRARTNSLWGTQSRTKQTISAPSSMSLLTSQPPSSPVAPVTNTGRSSQNELLISSLISIPSKEASHSAKGFQVDAYHGVCPYIAKSCHGGRLLIDGQRPDAQVHQSPMYWNPLPDS